MEGNKTTVGHKALEEISTAMRELRQRINDCDDALALLLCCVDNLEGKFARIIPNQEQ
jgi:hypothetical protein